MKSKVIMRDGVLFRCYDLGSGDIRCIDMMYKAFLLIKGRPAFSRDEVIAMRGVLLDLIEYVDGSWWLFTVNSIPEPCGFISDN